MESELPQASQITVIDEHPLPMTEDEAEEFQENNPQFGDTTETLHPEELYEEYVDVLGSNNDWRVFRVHIYGLARYVFVWNHQLGYGIRVRDEEGSFRSFLDALMQSAEVVA